MAESLGQATVDLIANTGGFEAGMDRAARKMQSVSKEAAYQGNQLEKLVGAIDPVTGALNRLDKQQQQLDSHFKAGRLPVEDYQKFTTILNAQKAATDATVSGFGKLDRQMASNGQTLKQYQNNLRGVPAQFTDIFTSLQGGQAPLTVLLQQGGQLKDMFGGVGAASKALGGYVLGLVNPISLVAAAVAATGVAYYQGSKEATAYNTALINTGNFAGTSAESLAGMASRIAQTTGTVGAAAAVLAQIAGSGKIAVDQFELIATAALATQKATGQAASEIVANFVKIAEDPLKATLELNKQMNYLTETVYSQIKAFEDAGNSQAAVNLAQNEYAKAQKERAAGIIEDLGYVESAWNSVAAAAKGAWDAFLSVGRTSPLEDQIKTAQKLVDDLADARKRALPGTPSNSIREEQAQKDLTDLLVQYDERQKRESSDRVAAQQKKDALEAAQYLDKVNTEFSDKQSQRDKARAAYNLNVEKLRAGVAGGTVLSTDPRLNAERIAKDLDGIDAKYAERKTARAQSVRAYVEDAGTKELDQAKQVYAALQAQSLAIGTQEGATRKIGAAAQELAKWEQQIADIKTKGTLTAAQKSLLADESAITAQKQQNAQLEAQNVQREKAAASAQKLLSLEQQLNDELQNVQSGFDQQLAGVGLGDEARKRLQDDLKIREDYQKKLEQLNRDYRKIQNPTAEDTSAYEAQNAVIKSALERRLDIQKNYYAAEDAAQASWSTGALQALNTYMESANDIAAQSRTLVANSLSQLEDAFVKLATDGKLSFKSLADSIIADLARIAAKTLIVQPLLNAFFGGGGSGATSFGGAVGSMLGGNTAGGDSNGWGGMVSLGKNLYSAWSNLTGVGSSIASGYASGGIGGAIQGGAGYYGNMLSNIGSTLSKGFSNLASTFTGATAAQTAATIGAQGVTSAALSGAVTEGATAIGAQFTTGVATTTAATYAAAEAGAAATAASLGGQISAAMSSVAAMWPLAVVMGMYQSGKLYDQGVRPDAGEIMDSGGKTALGKVAMAPGAAMSGFFEAQDKVLSKVVGGKWAAILSGSTLHQAVTKYVGEKLFGGGWQTKDGGISLGVENGEFDAQQYIYQKKKGGLFSSSKKRTRYSELDAETENALGAAYNDKILNSMGLFSALGVQLSDAVLDGLNVAATKISTQGKTPEAIQEELNKWFSGLGDSAVSAINAATNSGLENYNFEALTTFVNDLYSVNDSFDMLGLKLYDVSVSTGFMAEQLIAMAGGLEALKAGESSFFENFYTDTEKADYALRTVNKQFEAMGVKLPGTRDAYRDMVEALDRTTESGRQMYVTLTSLSGNAAQTYSILEQRAAAAAQAQQQILTGLVNAASSAQAAVQRAINAQKASINDMLQTAQSNVSGLTSVSNDLSSALKALRGDSDSATKMLRAQAVATVQSALASARAGGSLVDFPGLKDALDTVGSNSTDVYSTLEDFNRDQAQTAYALEVLNKLNGKQLTSAEQTVKSLQSQLERLDAQLALSQALLDGVNGIDTSILSVGDAIRQMNASILAVLKAQGGVAPGGVSSSIDLLYGAILGRTPDEAGKNYWLDQIAKGNLRPDQLEEAIRNAAKVNGTLPAFARGTNSWDGGPALMGEFGPELVLPNGGATVYNAQDTSRILNRTGNSDPQAASDLRDQARKNDQRWTQLLRYTQYLEQGFINGFPTVAEG